MDRICQLQFANPRRSEATGRALADLLEQRLNGKFLDFEMFAELASEMVFVSKVFAELASEVVFVREVTAELA